MRNKSALDEWLMFDSAGFQPLAAIANQRNAEVRAGLDQLGSYLDNPAPPKRFNLMNIRLPGRWNGTLAKEDLPRAQLLYQRVFETGGNGSTYTQEALLYLIAQVADAETIPFWLGLLDISRMRDTFANKRRDLACSALGLLMFHNNKIAEDALWQSVDHVIPEVCTSAMYTLGMVVLRKKRQPTKAVIKRLADNAVQNRSGLVRYLARTTLRHLDLPVPLDNPGGVYALKVTFKGDKQLFRTIELRSEQTIDELLSAFLHALDWDTDHLHAFYMNGAVRDPRFEINSIEGDSNPPYSFESVIGELGLSLKHRIGCNYDFGDNHWFAIEVVAIRPRDEAGSIGQYPRIIDSRGKAPKQYWHGEDEEE